MSVLTSAQLSTLVHMLEYCRPYGSRTDDEFREVYIRPLPGIHEDSFGNLITKIGESRILWSSHTDTVHRHEGYQTVHVNRATSTIHLSKAARKYSNCLGADDTAGVFIMREMILAGIPGLYIFHYGEESGCIGSGDLAKYAPETLAGVDFAIALDRAGYNDIVASQLGQVCTSPEFVLSLKGALAPLNLGAARGVYTDTAEYMDIVPECTNLSVGYFHQHSEREYLDYAHVARLLTALCAMDQSVLVAKRDPMPVIEITSREVRQTPLPLWRRDEPYGSDTWCIRCEAPIIDYNNPAYYISEHCMCDEEYELIEWAESDEGDSTLSADDLAFLRYLKGLD